MMCDHSSTPCYLSGPHLGVISDISIYRNNPAPLDDDECILGDKAYCDSELEHKIITPIKKKKHRQLTEDENAYNKVLGWYRSSIEHTFGYMKRFKIIGKQFNDILLYIIY
jgi:DDE superfamily endonuclease